MPFDGFQNDITTGVGVNDEFGWTYREELILHFDRLGIWPYWVEFLAALLGKIAKGETIEIRLELNFDQPSMGTALNFGLEKLSDTLVMNLRGGKDIFITVFGDYRSSSFGCSLKCLVGLAGISLFSITVDHLASEYGDAVVLALDPATEAALLFLPSLPEPVIPYRFNDRVVAKQNNFSSCKKVRD